MSTRLADGLDGTCQRRTYRRPQPLAETHTHRIKMLRPISQGNTCRDNRIKQPCAIQMGFQTVGMRPVANFLDVRVGLNTPRTAVVRVFQTNQSRSNQMIVRRPDHTAELLRFQNPESPFDRSRHEAAQLSKRSLFVVVNVATRLTKKLIPGFTMDSHGNLVRHRSRRPPHRGGVPSAARMRRRPRARPRCGRARGDRGCRAGRR